MVCNFKKTSKKNYCNQIKTIISRHYGKSFNIDFDKLLEVRDKAENGGIKKNFFKVYLTDDLFRDVYVPLTKEDEKGHHLPFFFSLYRMTRCTMNLDKLINWNKLGIRCEQQKRDLNSDNAIRIKNDNINTYEKNKKEYLSPVELQNNELNQAICNYTQLFKSMFDKSEVEKAAVLVGCKSAQELFDNSKGNNSNTLQERKQKRFKVLKPYLRPYLDMMEKYKLIRIKHNVLKTGNEGALLYTRNIKNIHELRPDIDEKQNFLLMSFSFLKDIKSVTSLQLLAFMLFYKARIDKGLGKIFDGGSCFIDYETILKHYNLHRWWHGAVLCLPSGSETVKKNVGEVLGLVEMIKTREGRWMMVFDTEENENNWRADHKTVGILTMSIGKFTKEYGLKLEEAMCGILSSDILKNGIKIGEYKVSRGDITKIKEHTPQILQGVKDELLLADRESTDLVHDVLFTRNFEYLSTIPHDFFENTTIEWVAGERLGTFILHYHGNSPGQFANIKRCKVFNNAKDNIFRQGWFKFQEILKLLLWEIYDLESELKIEIDSEQHGGPPNDRVVPYMDS